MKKSSNDDNLRNQVIGLGSTSVRKNYYRELMKQKKSLEEQNEKLQEEVERRKLAEDQLKSLNEELEQKVEERTNDLNELNKSLQNSINELKKTQEYLIKVEKLASLSALVKGISHEINTPLGTGITTISFAKDLSENLLSKVDVNHKPKVKKILEAESMALESVLKAADLVNNFKKIAADQQEYKIVSFNFFEYARMVVESMTVLRNLDVEVRIHCSESLVIKGYPGVLSQLINSFIVNSIEHGLEDHMIIDMFFNVYSDGVEFIYQDDGKGCDDENLGKLFDPFYTTSLSQDHSGLGLFTVYTLVTNILRGSIEVENRDSGGLRFTTFIPRRDHMKDN